MTESRNWEEVARLVVEAQAGEADAFRELLVSHRAAVSSTLIACGVRSEDTARDLAQEVALRAWRRLATLEDPRSFTAWIRRIAANAGVAAPGAVLAQMQRRGPGYGYDAVARKIVPMAKTGIVDAAGVLRHALQTAASGSVMALTTETMVLKRDPQTSMEP